MKTSADDEQSRDDWDLGALFAILWSRRNWIFSSVALFGAAFATVAFLTTPVYRATVIMVPADTEDSGVGGLSSVLGQLGGFASLAGIDLPTGGSAPEESLAVLRSRSFTEAFIVDKQLMPELFPKRRRGITAGLSGDAKEPTLVEAYRYFDEHVRSIGRDRTTGLISLNIDWTNPEQAAEWANSLVARLNAEMRRRTLENSSAAIEYLQKALEGTSVIETREAINRLMEVQINRGMLATATEEYAFRAIDKAMPPDIEDPIRPNKVLMLALGVALGGLAGSLAALLVPRRDRREPISSEPAR